MFHSDQPIDKKEFDCLNRTEFSKKLAKAVLSYTKSDNFAISLCGKWGSGKTSIINMVIEEIDNLSKNLKEEEKPIIIKFNPWNYSDCAQLISQFFVAIQARLKIATGNKGLKIVCQALEGYSSLLDYSAYIPVIGHYLGPIKGILTGVGKQIKGKVDKDNSIEVKKQKVVEALKEQKQKFIIVIDDIDRLNNAQIRAIFQLVNSLAGFPNMIYLLSFDREVVTRALQEEQNCDGEEYLEKIIQVPFEVPEANKDLVNKVLFDRLTNIIFSEENEDTNFDSEYWGTVFSNCISPFIDSIREVNRVVNVFEFKYGLMSDEVNPIDLLALTTLQVCAPTIFRWIYHNANNLVGSVESAGGISGTEQKENYKQYLELFKSIYPEKPCIMMKIIQVLFPKFSWKTGGYSRNRESEDELRYKDKVASADRIERYFNLSMEEISIGKKQIQNTITKYGKVQLINYFMELMKYDKLVEYMQELQAYIPDISADRKDIFADALIEIQTLDAAYERKGRLSLIPASKCYVVLIEIFKCGDLENNEILLRGLIENSCAKNISIICKIIEDVEEAYGRIGKYINSSYQLIGESNLSVIEDKLLKKIKEFAENENFLDYREWESVYYIWKHLDKESLDLYMKRVLQKPVNVPKYLQLCVGVWSGGNTNGWHFEKEAFLEYIEKRDAYEKILSLKNTEVFSALNHSDKEIAIAFYLWCNSESGDYHDINRENVNAVIPQWEMTRIGMDKS